MAEFASKGVAGSGLGLGIAGTALGLLNNGGNVGACEYENRKAFFTTKPDIPTVTFDVLVYSEDNSVTKKIYANITSELTSEEVTAIKQFAKAQFTDKSNTN